VEFIKVFCGLYKFYRVNKFPYRFIKASLFYKVYILAFSFVILNVINSFNKVLILTIHFN